MDEPLPILDLPYHVLCLIASFLQLADFYRYKLVCKAFNESSYSRTAMNGLFLRIILFDEHTFGDINFKRVFPNSFKCLSLFLEKLQYGKNATVSISPSKGDDTQNVFENLLENYVKDALEIEISIKHIETISRCCSNTDTLILHSGLVLTSGVTHDIGQTCHESCLKNFKCLTKLCMSYLTIPTVVFSAILTCIPSLHTLKLSQVYIVPKHLVKKEHLNFYDKEIGDMSIATIRENVLNARHITTWVMDQLSICDSVIELPVTATSVTCRGTNINLYFKNLERFVFDNEGSYNTLFPKQNIQECKKLVHMVLEMVNFKDGCLPICSSVQYLKLSHTRKTMHYLEQLSLYCSDLKYLILIYPRDCPYDLKLAQVIQSFDSLRYLKILESSLLTMQPLVYELRKLKLSSLKNIVLCNGYTPRKNIPL